MAGLTLQQIRDFQLRADIDQLDPTNSRFSQSQLTDYINQALNKMATIIEYPRDFVQVTAQANVGDYTLLSDTLVIRTAYYGDTNTAQNVKPLEIISEETLKELYPAWLDDTGTNNAKPKYLIVKDRRTISVYPRPDALNTSHNEQIILDYIYNPAPLVADSDIPDIPIPFQYLVHFYAASLALIRNNNYDGAAKMKAMFDANVKEIKATVTKETSEGMFLQWGWDPGFDDETRFYLQP